MRLTFELVDLMKQIALPKVVGLIQCMEGWNTTKSLSKAEFTLPFCLNA